MHPKLSLLLLILSVWIFAEGVAAYKIPKAHVEVLDDGFRISIPDEVGIRNVAFHINRNRPLKPSEPGEFSAQLRLPTNGRWSHKFPRVLRNGDILYFWINVQFNELVYLSATERFQVESEDENTLLVLLPTTKPNPTDIDIKINECKPSITIVKGRKVELCRGQMIFEETFEGPLNTSRWMQEVRLPLDTGDAEFLLYESTAKVTNGLLIIEPTLWNGDQPLTDIKSGQVELDKRCTGTQDRAKECSRRPEGLAHNTLPPVISARINTKRSFSFKYGRIDIRAKLPQGDWLIPLLLLEPLTNSYGQTPYNSGQLRVAFARGNEKLITATGQSIDGRTLYGGAVLVSDAALRERSMVSMNRNTHLGENFHVYSMLWTDRKLLLEIDGQEYGQIDGDFLNKYLDASDVATAWKTGEYIAPFDQEFYITLGLSVGGHGDFPDDCISGQYSKPWINTSPKGEYQFWLHRRNWKPSWTSPSLQVDYVRVYTI